MSASLKGAFFRAKAATVRARAGAFHRELLANERLAPAEFAQGWGPPPGRGLDFPRGEPERLGFPAVRLSTMWELVLPALIGAGSSIAVLLLPRVWDSRSVQRERRQAWVAALLDTGLLGELAYSAGTLPDSQRLAELLDMVPTPSAAENLAASLKLSTAAYAARRQVGDLYGLRVSETIAGRPFSDTADNAIAAFNDRLVRWARTGRRLNRLYQPSR